jgi:D-alanyl-D-alanine carboxypeptidase
LNTDKATDIPGLIGGKTGYTDLAGGNLAIVFDADIGHPVIVVALHSTKEGRFEDVRALTEYAHTLITERSQ